MNTLVCRLSSRFANRFGTLQLSVLMLLAFLQRTPVARVLSAVESAWVSSSLGQVLKATAVVASTLGAVDTLAGATQFTANPANPASATVGTPFAAAFAITGAPKTVSSYTVSGLPPGLTVPGASFNAGTSTFTLNGTTGTLTGTPTTAGEYFPLITAWEFANGTGRAHDSFYTINVGAGGPVAPAITTQPASLTRTAGQAASFSVTASGSPTPTFQWQKETVNIGGATSSTFSIASTTVGDAGNYRVVVTNGSGSVISNNATLTVNVPPSISTHPASQTVNTGQPVTFSVTASGTPSPTSFQWRKGGVNIGGATSSSFTINSVVTGDAGSYSVVVSNVAGSATSNNAALTVNAAPAAPAITTQPAAVTVNAGQSATFSVGASGSPAPTFQWRKGGVNIGGATGASLSISSTSASDAGNYSVVATNASGSATSNDATLTINTAPAITTQPAGQSVNTGQTATFSVVATGTPTPTFQWRKGGVNIGGATGSAFSITSVVTGDAANYSVVVTNSVGSVTSSNATLTVTTVTSPVFTTQPANKTAVPGGSVTFTVAVTGTPPPTFQWRKNGVNITGATNATLTLTNVQSGDATTYTVVATNSQGSSTSSGAVLALIAARPGTFDAQGYLNNNPDVAAAIGNVSDALDQAWIHYLQSGVSENRTDGEFNVLTYLAQYPAVQTLFGSNLAGAAQYWYTTGRALGHRIPSGFDIQGYFARNNDVAAVFANDLYGAWLHFLNFGINEGRQYDSQFIVEEYLLLNTDLTNAFGTDKQAALLHWLAYGKPLEDRIGRVPIGFNVDSYLARYPDLSAAFNSITPRAVRNVTVWNHYLDYGVTEGRSDGDFEAYNYLATNSDLAAVLGNDVNGAALHWYFYGRREGRRIPSNFDVAGYRTRNPDIVVIWGNDLYGAWLHFRDVGVFEGRVYDDLFRVLEYRARYADVQTSYGNDLTGVLNHWLFYGKPEGRLGRNP